MDHYSDRPASEVRAGFVAWEVTPGGTQQVHVRRRHGDYAEVYSRGYRRSWAYEARTVPVADLFVDREAARGEFRRRKVKGG